MAYASVIDTNSSALNIYSYYFISELTRAVHSLYIRQLTAPSYKGQDETNIARFTALSQDAHSFSDAL